MTMKVGGIDGCKAGWILVYSDEEGYGYGLYPTFVELITNNRNLQRLLVDIPIGLSAENHSRQVDSLLRKALGRRSSTVFNAPCREAVYEKDPQLARLKNLQIEGKSLSIQSLAIRHKIREVDILLLQQTGLPKIYESHPEVCFKYLNPNQQVLLSQKSKSRGREERLAILANYDPSIRMLYQKILSATKRKDAKPDDIIDAICLCLLNKLAKENSLQFFQSQQLTDQLGIEMKVAYFNPIAGTV